MFFLQKSEDVHQNSLLFSRAMYFGGLRGHHGGFSQFGEGKKWKTDVFFAQQGPNGFRMCSRMMKKMFTPHLVWLFFHAGPPVFTSRATRIFLHQIGSQFPLPSYRGGISIFQHQCYLNHAICHHKVLIFFLSTLEDRVKKLCFRSGLSDICLPKSFTKV